MRIDTSGLLVSISRKLSIATIVVGLGILDLNAMAEVVIEMRHTSLHNRTKDNGRMTDKSGHEKLDMRSVSELTHDL